MDKQIKKAMEQVVSYLDSLMEVNPTRELADTSNYLSALLEQA